MGSTGMGRTHSLGAMSPSDTGLSRSVEDYLKAIYGISERGETASTSAIADALDVQPASVTGMVKRMAETSLLEHVPYRGVRLTATGTMEALKVLRRHRVIETYLCERLGYSWDDVHEEAERLEHAASEILVDRMAAALEYLSHDPHGSPIPTRTGMIEATDFSTLAEASPGAVLRVRAVRDEDPARLRTMEAQGLTPGVLLIVHDRPASDDIILVHVGDPGAPLRAVQRDLALEVYVIPDDD